MQRNRGFSLMELMVVIVVIGLLAGVVAVNLVGSLERGRRTAALSDLKAIGGALQMYYIDHGGLPATLEKLLDAPRPGRRPYLRSLHKDPWGTEYTYERETYQDYQLRSLGADRKRDGEGDAADIWEPPKRA